MPLDGAELEEIARRRMFCDVQDAFRDVVRREAPRALEDLDESMEEYIERVMAECGDLASADEQIECVSETKRREKPEVKRQIRSRM